MILLDFLEDHVADGGVGKRVFAFVVKVKLYLALGLVLGIGLSLGFQIVMNRKVFFTGPAANTWLKNVFWYGLFDYALIYTNALIGTTICIRLSDQTWLQIVPQLC